MLIRNKTTLTKVEYDAEQYHFTHIQPIEGIKREAAEIRQFSDNGWTKERNFRQIARIPVLEAMKHPEIFHDARAMRRYLQNEGSDYRTVNGGF